MCGCNQFDLIGYIQQKFGRIRIPTPNDTSEQQKALNQFQFEVVYPTNWRGSYEPLLGSIPVLGIRYGGFVPQTPYFANKNYQGVFPMTEQPIVNPAQPFTVPRYS